MKKYNYKEIMKSKSGKVALITSIASVLLISGFGINQAIHHNSFQELMIKASELGVEERYGDLGLFIKKETLKNIENDLINIENQIQQARKELIAQAKELGIDENLLIDLKEIDIAQLIETKKEEIRVFEEQKIAQEQEAAALAQAEEDARNVASNSNSNSNLKPNSNSTANGGSNHSGTNTSITPPPPTNGGVPSWVVGVCSDYGVPIVSDENLGFACAQNFKPDVPLTGGSSFYNPDGSFNSIEAVFADGTVYGVSADGYIDR